MIYHELWLMTPRVKFSCAIEGRSLKSKYDAVYNNKLDQYFDDCIRAPTTLPRWLSTSKEVG